MSVTMEYSATEVAPDIKKLESQAKPSSKEKVSPKEKTPKVEKERVGGPIPKDLAEKIKDIAFWTPGLTICDLIEEGLRFVVKKYEEDGEIQRRDGEIKRGRRPKVASTKPEPSQVAIAVEQIKVSQQENLTLPTTPEITQEVTIS